MKKDSSIINKNKIEKTKKKKQRSRYLTSQYG